jgi:hypothetical protein
MVVLIVAAILGGLSTFALLFPYGALAAFIGAPFGGSFLALVVGMLMAFRSARAERRQEQSHGAPLEKRKASV